VSYSKMLNISQTSQRTSIPGDATR